MIILHWSCRPLQFRAARVEREGLRPNGHLLRNLAPGILNVQGYSESSFLSFWSSEGKVKMDQNRRDDWRLGDPPGPASRDSGSCFQAVTGLDLRGLFFTFCSGFLKPTARPVENPDDPNGPVLVHTVD